jgi:hypothetical protein
MRRSVRVASGLIGLGAALLGCPGTLDDPARFFDAAGNDAALAGDAALPDAGASCPDVPQTIFASTCTGAGCHNAHDKTQGLDLQSPNVATRLLGAQATEGPGLLIDPMAPSSSVLYMKLTPMPPFGARMPLAGMLDNPSIACVLAWIVEQTSDAGSSGGSTPEGGADAGIGDGGATESGP